MVSHRVSVEHGSTDSSLRQHKEQFSFWPRSVLHLSDHTRHPIACAADLKNSAEEEKQVKDEREEEAEPTEHEVTNRWEAFKREEAKVKQMIKVCVTCTNMSPNCDIHFIQGQLGLFGTR